MTEYDYTISPLAIDSLQYQIQISSIVTALDHINALGNAVQIFFKAVLSDADKVTLDAVVSAHDGIPLPQNQIQSVTVTNTPTVTTQFEKRDKTLKLAYTKASVGLDSTATALLKVPGTYGSSDGRWISSGTAFFDIQTPGDKILSVRFTDEDNLLGYGVGFVVGSYTDDDVDNDNQGWVISPRGWVEAIAIGGYGFAPAGFYIKIIGKKANNITIGTFYINIEWGKTE